MRKNILSWLRLLAVLIMAMPAFAAQPAVAQGNCRTFAETAKTVCDQFLAYWNANGGLAQQGFPISEVLSETSDTDGKIYTVQYFERAVFEMHPEFAGTPNEVLLQLLGVYFWNRRYSSAAPNQVANSDPGARVYPETGKTLGGTFQQYWDSHGGLRQQGYPISDEFIEVNDLDGKPYRVQYFERAVFEYHPEYAGTPNEVLLSQVGTFAERIRHAPVAPPTSTPAPVQPTATPIPAQPTPTTPSAPPPSDPCAGIPPSTDASVTPPCGPAGSRFTFSGRGFQPGENVGVYVTTPDGAVYGANFQVEADSNGQVGGVYIDTLPGDPTGIWAVTYEGVTTHKKSIGYFKVYSNTPPTPTPVAGGGGGGTCDTSGSVNGTATPNSGGPGTVIVFRATGFTPGEDVSYWLTLPDGSVVGTSSPVPDGVNSDGSVGPLSLTITSGLASLASGRWAITFEGASSHHQAIIYFCVHQ